jgi:hypothetical protein
VLRDGHNAVLVPPDDPPAAVQRLATLVASPETCRRLGAQAFADVEHGTWADRAAAVLEFIRPSKEEE